MLDHEDSAILGAIAAASSTVAGLGSVTVATVTTTAPGILGVLGFTTTTAVALSPAGIVVAAGLVFYGVKKVRDHTR
ncbi:MAG: hypothetical protein WBL95_22880 [Microcoleus sp.]